jgi:TolA-binding protein
VWELRDGRLRVYGDGYQNYLTRRDQEGQIVEETITEVSAPERTAVPDAGPALSKNAQRRHAQRLQALEDQVHELELELERLTDELQEATLQQEVDEIVRISHEYGAVEETLVDVMARWEAAHEH